ncbi:sensor histidine kinase [Kitasatospora sp. NPDC052868]|uniref:sensor histidine kinase n=1 Tax=Kitasatospora sp. NPDC052868 TaxID=3364060 RepID=UPI0037CBA757
MDQPLHPPLTRRLRRSHLVGADCVLAVLLAVPFLPVAARDGRPVDAVLLALAVVGTAARRLLPLTALALTAVATSVGVSDRAASFSILAMVLAGYVVAVELPTRVSARALAATVALLGLVGVFGHPRQIHYQLGPGYLVEAVVAAGTVWALGWSVGRGRAYSEGLRRQAEYRAEAEADLARRALVEERLRIARELHDVVAHSMSVIAVQAGVGHHVYATRPEEAAKALAVIETTSRAALGEMRLLLGVLRDGNPAELLPGGLADLPELLAQIERTGVRVRLSVTGTVRRLPPGVDRAAYRILQEALTNVVRHARTDRAEAAIGYREDEVTLTVTDAGSGSPGEPPAPGNGLIGIAERAVLYGGEAVSGPLQPHGFRVAVTLGTGAARSGAPANEAAGVPEAAR